ncbi:class I SAM-dependent methyltransferase [Oleomonas cavernae]|nr:class I SAM-dependent methyltransferase [Oleomonas cavernae]
MLQHTKWSREQVENLLATETFGYQKVALPYGLSTDGDDRSATAREIFPDDLTGKTVLDLGCNTGYFCFEAVKRGAARVVGYDHSPAAIKRARLLADCLGATVEFEVRDLNTFPVVEKFDYILCLNVLHHLDNPLLVIEQTIAAARERLALEMAGLGFQTVRRRLFTASIAALFMGNAPVIYVGRQPHTPGRDGIPKVKYFITPRALANILLRHSKTFARVERVKSKHKGRYLILGHKALPGLAGLSCRRGGA